MARKTEAARSALFSLASGTTAVTLARGSTDRYTCRGDTLSLAGDDAVVELRRP